MISVADRGWKGQWLLELKAEPLCGVVGEGFSKEATLAQKTWGNKQTGCYVWGAAGKEGENRWSLKAWGCDSTLASSAVGRSHTTCTLSTVGRSLASRREKGNGCDSWFCPRYGWRKVLDHCHHCSVGGEEGTKRTAGVFFIEKCVGVELEWLGYHHRIPTLEVCVTWARPYFQSAPQ